MDIIELKDYEVVACHGVNEEEKITPQKFLISARVFCDVTDAAKSDDVDKTISYASIKKDIKCHFEENCFNLIETLAYNLCNIILKKYDIAKEVEITIKKPQAPMSGVFKYPSVTVSRAWHKVYLSLGSNIGDMNGYLDFAVKALSSDENIKNLRESSRYHTEPYGCVATREFVNSAVEIDTLYRPQELLKVVNKIESDGERVRNKRWGDRTLDIDIIFYDNLVVEDSNLCIPHIDMQYRAFVLKPLHELCPYKVHPLLNKRIEDILKELPMPINEP